MLARGDAPLGGPPDSPTAVERLFNLISRAVPGGVMVVGPEGTIVRANPQLGQQFGYRPQDLIGRTVELILPGSVLVPGGQDASSFPADEPTAVRNGRKALGRRSDGSSFPLEIGVSPIATPQGAFALAVLVDADDQSDIEPPARDGPENQIAFERLIADLSAEFINLSSDNLPSAVHSALGRIGDTLDVDRCTFYRVEQAGMVLDPASWQREGLSQDASVGSVADRFPWSLETALSGRIVCFSKIDDVPHPTDRAGYLAMGTKSGIVVPLSVSGDIVGAVGFCAVRREREWSAEAIHRCRVIASVFGNVLARRQSDEAVNRAMAEVVRLRDRLQDENLYLRQEVQERLGSSVIVGHSPALRRILDQIQQVAVTDSTVLLLGETGTGKELFATQIHELSSRRQRPMVRVNCSAIPQALIESELFGREKGAFTDALSRQIGRFELADRSSIFLDEIGDLPADVQVKLLRVLEERQIERLGSPKSIHVDTRIIAATHRNLEQRIVEGTFREDLFYRLNVFPIQVPPLRERVEDVPLLVWRFVGEFSKAFGKEIDAISKEDMAALQSYSWPGNIRELRNVVERAMIVATGKRLVIPTPKSPSADKKSARLVDVEREHIRTVLESTRWRIRGAGGAADRLGLRPTTLETRMTKLGLKRPKPV